MIDSSANKTDGGLRALPLYALAFALSLFMLNRIAAYNGGRLADLVPDSRTVSFTDAGSYTPEPSVYTFASSGENNAESVAESVYPTASRRIVCYPLKGEITSAFAYRSDPFGSGEGEFHTGCDIAAEFGSDICAYTEGVVTQASYDDRSGYYIIIRHNDELETFYAHCSGLIAEAGDYVRTGDVIAKAGSTGRSTGCHLHFEVRIDGSAVDPELYLELAASSSVSD